MTGITATLSRRVRERADGCCEYCRMPEDFDYGTFGVDHIIARKHGGPTVAENLCLSCYYWKSQTRCLHFQEPLILD
ncbi:HNH endonuclease [Paludisphaera rhizosphaerae]|uniref:HNH endonuclease n=1 Tax=Paludisphaera rhizosphaerae TaxID=2711216 RepID=UPI00210322E0|nr:HNH endonuclease signature motif containing protein [Paludisphaera rhizosphaerae]